MLILSFNVRGLGGRIKKNKARELILANSLDFVAIQETLISKVFESLVYFLYGNSFYDWSFRPSMDNSGGLISMWCSSKVRSLFSFSGPWFLSVCLEELL